jgi:hypothetical protein
MIPKSFSAVPRASGPVFTFCALGIDFGGTEGVPSCFHVFRSRKCFRRYRGRRVPFSCFALPNSFSTVLRASCPIIYVLRSRTRFRRYRGHRVSFFLFLHVRTHFRRFRGHWVPFSYSTRSVLIFGGTEGVVSRFHVLCSRSRFRRYRGCLVPFSCFVLLNSFSAVPSVSGPVFIIYAPGLVFGGTESVGSCFHVCAAGLIFGGVECVRSRFHVLRA